MAWKFDEPEGGMMWGEGIVNDLVPNHYCIGHGFLRIIIAKKKKVTTAASF